MPKNRKERLLNTYYFFKYWKIMFYECEIRYTEEGADIIIHNTGKTNELDKLFYKFAARLKNLYLKSIPHENIKWFYRIEWDGFVKDNLLPFKMDFSGGEYGQPRWQMPVLA